jgi:hypothetical protein
LSALWLSHFRSELKVQAAASNGTFKASTTFKPECKGIPRGDSNEKREVRE